MTQSTETERVEFEASVKKLFEQFVERDFKRHCDNYKYEGTQMLWELWQAARRAQVVPQGWKLVPEESTDAMARAFRADDAPYYFAMTTIRCNDFAERWRAVIAAAPQPPEAAPVQLPEPWAISHHNRVQYSNAAWYEETPDGTKLYTEQQVRPLLETQKFQLDELAMLTRKLVRSLRKAAPDNESAEKALDYLKRKGLGGNPLRDTQG